MPCGTRRRCGPPKVTSAYKGECLLLVGCEPMRFEAHLHRQLLQTLHELEARQARRQGEQAPLARLDVQGVPEG